MSAAKVKDGRLVVSPAKAECTRGEGGSALQRLRRETFVPGHRRKERLHHSHMEVCSHDLGDGGWVTF